MNQTPATSAQPDPPSAPPVAPMDKDLRRARRAAIEQVIEAVMQRRANGEAVLDADILAANPSLRPELDEELNALREIHRIRLAAEKAADACPSDPPANSATTPDSDLLPGDNPHRTVAINGYTVLEEIGSGGQGTVFKATQDTTGRAVAIKVIPGGLLTGSHTRARFDREVDILAKLDHPLIVSIIDRGRTADGSLYLVMPFVDGRPLDAHLWDLGSMSPFDTTAVVRLFVQIGRAVAEAHRSGIIHRDLKPANIRVDPRGDPHILDFGLARPDASSTEASSNLTNTGQIIGSLPWTSPEHIAHKPVGTPADIYALGIMLYHALTGVFPYTVYGPIRDVLENIAAAIPEPPSRTSGGIRRGISPGLDPIVMRCLAKTPEDRYANGEELAADLQRYLDGQLPAPRTLTLAHPRRRRKPIMAGLLVAMIALLGISAWRLQPGAQRQPISLPFVVNSLGMKLMRIPAGDFIMGSPPGEAGRTIGELQRVEHITTPFYIGSTEVTQKQYAAIMGSIPKWQSQLGDNLPVAGVSAEDAVGFCRRLSEKEHRTYRLPTEVQWEYACRASSTSTPFSGTGKLPSMGWYKLNSDNHAHPVGSLAPNDWGLFDMHGNVAEWCRIGGDPDGPATDASDANRGMYTARGGGFASNETGCRAGATRGQFGAISGADLGFRIVMEDPNIPRAPTMR